MTERERDMIYKAIKLIEANNISGGLMVLNYLHDWDLIDIEFKKFVDEMEKDDE